MKLVTGNNISEAIATQSILSIQHSLDGLSFCVSRFGKPLWLHRAQRNDLSLAELRAGLEPLQRGYSLIRVIADSDRACLIPEACYEEGTGESFMRINGIAPTEDAQLHVLRREGYVQLMYLPRALIRDLAELFPQAVVECMHPLWFGIRRASKGTCVDLNFSTGRVHLAAAEKGALRYAETLICPTPADLLYILSEWQRSCPLEGAEFVFSGEQAETFRKQTASYYKKTSLDLPVPPKSVRPADVSFFANLIRAAYENY